MHEYSIIILLKRSEEEIVVNNLQLLLSKKYHGQSALNLPPHITLIRWKTLDLVPTSFKLFIHQKEINFDIFIENVEMSANKKSVWYKVAFSKDLCNTLKFVYSCLLNSGISKKDIFLSSYFHLTLAYKDYSEKEINEIFEHLKQIKIDSYFKLSADKIAICNFNDEGIWQLV